jgi:hypothetical protein
MSEVSVKMYQLFLAIAMDLYVFCEIRKPLPLHFEIGCCHMDGDIELNLKIRREEKGKRK